MDKKKLELAKKVESIIKPFLKSGDVVNSSGRPKFLEFWMSFAYGAIRGKQDKLYLNEKIIWTSPNRDTHSTIYFDRKDIDEYLPQSNGTYKNIIGGNKDACVFSVQPPKATFAPLVDECGGESVSVYRYTKKQFTKEDINFMLEGTLPIIGTKYDIGQLIDIALNQMAGYPNIPVINAFDMGENKKVCSVGVAAVYTYWRHEMEIAHPGIYIPRLFSKINQDQKMWPKGFVDDFNISQRWDVESVYPANFSNAQTHFDGEFELIVKVDVQNLKIVYQKS